MAISSISHFSKRLRLSSFAASFVILGVLTSTPELAIGLTAVAQNDSQIFVGNLIGGIPVIFLFIIPILAIFGKGINIKNKLDNKTFLTAIAVILAPSFLILDHKITLIEGILLILLYFMLLFLIEKNQGLLDGENKEILDVKAYSVKDLLKLLVGIGLVFAASNIIVNQTLYFSSLLNIAPFYISLIVLSLGTNIPEISLAIRSVIGGGKDIAFGDYLGSAAANTLLFGLFTILSSGEVFTVDNFLIAFFFIATGLILFYLFARTKNIISQKNQDSFQN